MPEEIVKTETDERETIVVTLRKSMLGRHLMTPEAKWERKGERKAPMKTRMFYCETENA